VHPGDLAGGEFSDIEMTWLLYCAGTATELQSLDRHYIAKYV